MKRYGIFSILLSLYTSTLLASTDLVEELRPDSRIQKHASYDDDIQCVIDGVQAIRNAAPCSSELIDWFKEHSENQKYIINSNGLATNAQYWCNYLSNNAFMHDNKTKKFVKCK